MPPPNEIEPPESGLRILLLEDDEAVRRSLHLMLRARGFEVSSYAAPGVLLADPTIASAGFLIADYQLTERDGVETLRALRSIGWQGRAILITAFSTGALRDAAMAAGYHAVLEKPLGLHELMKAIG